MRRGHVAAARALVDALPHLATAPDGYGVKLGDLIAAHEAPLTAAPKALRYDATAAAAAAAATAAAADAAAGVPSAAAAAATSAGATGVTGADPTGGWPTAEVQFPGYHRAGSRGRCGIAEVDGAAVSGSAEGAALLLSEFVLKRRPVLVKNAVAHDVMLRPLLESMKLDALAASEWGQNTWDVSILLGGAEKRVQHRGNC